MNPERAAAGFQRRPLDTVGNRIPASILRETMAALAKRTVKQAGHGGSLRITK
jgi:hypothetical protein